jgi:hypothetical protein
MTHDQVQSIQIVLACHHQSKFLCNANMRPQKIVMNLLSKLIVTASGCDAAGCSSQAGFPSFSPVLRLYKQSGNVAIVPASKVSASSNGRYADSFFTTYWIKC